VYNGSGASWLNVQHCPAKDLKSINSYAQNAITNMHMFAAFAKITLDLTMFTKSLERHKYDLAFVNLKNTLNLVI
jgi:hypothetical protein